jgi:hypothetical protein
MTLQHERIMNGDSAAAKLAGRTRQFRLLTLLAFVTACALWFAAVRQFGWPAFLIGLVIALLAAVVWHAKERRKTAGFLAACFALIGLLLACVLPLFHHVHTPARRTVCANHLRQLGLALAVYHEQYGSFPPAHTIDENGRPLHSWRTLILPYLEQGSLYAQLHLDEPWDSPHNVQFHHIVLPLFTCPSNYGEKGAGTNTNYVAVVGPLTMWPGSRSTSIADIKDGQGKTIMLVETADSGIHWMEPRDLHVVQMTGSINAAHGQGMSSYHPGGINVVHVDLATGFLSDDTDRNRIKAMLTIAGGEDLPDVWE